MIAESGGSGKWLVGAQCSENKRKQRSETARRDQLRRLFMAMTKRLFEVSGGI
jgi:hypothetical protein